MTRPSAARRLTLAWTIGLLSAALFVGACYTMAQRLAAFNQTHQRPLWVFEEVTDPKFNFAGRPVELSNADDPDGWKLVVTYGDQSLRLRVTIPGERRLPGLLPHRDWMRVLRFAEQTNMRQEDLAPKLDAGVIPDRLVIVCRVPRPGADPLTWGRVWRKDTVFDFYEFKPEGGFTHTRLEYPHSKQDQPYAEGELREDTWQMQAALRTVPAGLGPKAKYRQDSMHALGWTWPLAFLGMVGVFAAFMIGAKGRHSDA